MKQLSKNDTQRFLQDVAELETKAFTLEQFAEKHSQYSKHKDIQDKIDNIEHDILREKNQVNHYEIEVKKAKEKYDKIQSQYQKVEQEYANLVLPKKTDNVNVKIDEDTLNSAVGTGIQKGCFISAGITIGITFLLLIINIEFAILSAPLIGIPIAIICCIRGAKKAQRKAKVEEYMYQKNEYYKKLLNKLSHERDSAEEELKNYQGALFMHREAYEQKQECSGPELQELIRKKSIADNQQELSMALAQSSRQSAQVIRKNLAKIYEASDLIPPDYREMDCVLAFQQIFRNDLADTMREAIMIYEQRVFRQEVIRGMDRIYHKLENLNSSMYYLKHTLTGIRDNVSMMSQDVFKMAGKLDQMSQQMSDNGQLQSKLLRETQASRYAIDAIKQSQLRCEKYLEKAKESSERMEQKMDN